MAAGLLYGLAHVFDCCDGMIARLKKNGTPIGRIVDGFADYVTTVAVFIGINIGLYGAGFEFFIPNWILLSLCGVFMIIHCMAVDFYKTEFMAHALNIVHSPQAERKIFLAEMAKLKQQRGRYISKLLIWFYLWYSRIQLSQGNGNKEKTIYQADAYYQANKSMLSLWSWISAPMHILVIIISAFLFKPEIIFYYFLGGANLWMVFTFILQVRINKKLVEEENGKDESLESWKDYPELGKVRQSRS